MKIMAHVLYMEHTTGLPGTLGPEMESITPLKDLDGIQDPGSWHQVANGSRT